MDAKLSLGEPRVLISRDALLHNASVVRRTVGPGVRICAMVKADAYGHGADIVADTLANFSTRRYEAPLADALAVARSTRPSASPTPSSPSTSSARSRTASSAASAPASSRPSATTGS